MAACLGSLVQLCCGERGNLQTNTTGKLGSVCSAWTTLGLPPPKAACTFWVHTAQAPGCSVRELSQVGPAFYVLPRSKPLRFVGVLQGHRPRWAVCFVPFRGPSHSGDWVLGQKHSLRWAMHLMYLLSPGHSVS